MPPMRQRRLPSKWRTKSFTIQALRVLWLVAVVHYELLTYYLSVAFCHWPDKALRKAGAMARPTHVLVVSDAQVLDDKVSSTWERVAQTLGELSLSKSWSAARRFRPDVVIFLGDMLDDGRAASTDDNYRLYVQRFRAMFPMEKTVAVHYVVGNHDVGLGDSQVFSSHMRRRYSANFGDVNQVLSLAGHTLVLLDTPGLVEEDYHRFSANVDFEDWPGTKGGTIEFVKGLAALPPREPVILFSHIPLARPDSASCGPLREHGHSGIRRGAGPGYQNLVGKQTTAFVLAALRPLLVLSGDDRDYCEHTHAGGVPEVTLKAFTAGRGIRRPGFQLLALAPGARAHAPCFLPATHGVWATVYAPLAVVTALALLYFGLLHPPKPKRLTGWGSGGSAGGGPNSAGAGASPPPTPFPKGLMRNASLQPPTARISRPSTPFEPVLAPGLAEDDTQYLPAPRGVINPLSPSEMSFGNGEHDASFFLPAPGTRKVLSTAPRPLTWYERVSGMIARRAMRPLRWAFGAPGARGGSWPRVFVRDAIATLWPAVLAGLCINWWMLR